MDILVTIMWHLALHLACGWGPCSTWFLRNFVDIYCVFKVGRPKGKPAWKRGNLKTAKSPIFVQQPMMCFTPLNSWESHDSGGTLKCLCKLTITFCSHGPAVSLIYTAGPWRQKVIFNLQRHLRAPTESWDSNKFNGVKRIIGCCTKMGLLAFLRFPLFQALFP